MSFVPARMTTTFGFSPITSWRNRTSICGDVWPSMPRLKYGFPGKNSAQRAPGLGNLIAEEHHALLAGRRGPDLAVVAAVARQARPVRQQMPIRRETLLELGDSRSPLRG